MKEMPRVGDVLLNSKNGHKARVTEVTDRLVTVAWNWDHDRWQTTQTVNKEAILGWPWADVEIVSSPHWKEMFDL